MWAERLKGKVYAGGVLAVLLYGCESWCLTAESVRRLSNWHNKRVREMCRVTMCQTFVHRITSESLQKRTGVFSLEHYLASRTLLWAGHVARMPKNRLPKRLMLSWIRGFEEKPSLELRGTTERSSGSRRARTKEW